MVLSLRKFLSEFYKTVTTAAIKVTETPKPVIQRRVCKDHGCCTFVLICLTELTITIRSSRREGFGWLTGIVDACLSSLAMSTLGVGGAGGGATGNSIMATSLRSLAPSELIACTHKMFHDNQNGNPF
jgi:hypothetical protein